MRKPRLTDATLKRIDALLYAGEGSVGGLATSYGLSRSALASQLARARKRGLLPMPEGRRYMTLTAYSKHVMRLPC